MKEFIDKLIERLEEEKQYCSYNPQIRDEAINKSISIVNELAEEYKGGMMLYGICMVCENKDTLCTHIGQVKEDCPFIKKAISTKITNADRIRGMTDEELYNLIEKIKMCGGLLRAEESSSECQGCKDGFCCNVLLWLKSEVEEKQ